MRVHRFYTGDKLKLTKDFWLHDEAILWQWSKVLRFREGQQVILFDGVKTERLYEITKLVKTEAHLVMQTELKRQLPEKHIYLFWSLLKKDNNDFILQKATELGVSNFVPMITERSIRDNFNIDRAQRIVQEASEQCGRSNIPVIREPLHMEKIFDEYSNLPLYIAQQGSSASNVISQKCGILIGPEGGWSHTEKQLFVDKQLIHTGISQFTLRAETAAIAAIHLISNH